MKKIIQKFVFLLGIFASAASYGQDPSLTSMRLVVPFAPGGGTDILARLLAPELSTTLGYPVIVDNRTGASGLLALDAVRRSVADGKTLIIQTPTTAVLAPLVGRSEFSNGGLEPISLLIDVPNVLVISPNLNVKTALEFFSALSTSSKPLSYASSGVDSILHLSSLLLLKEKSSTGLHIPYRGASPALQAIATGEVDFGFAAIMSALPLIQDGRLIAIAVTGVSRSPVLALIPTFEELGIKNFSTGGWNAVYGPRGMSTARIGEIQLAFQTALRKKEVTEKLNRIGAVPIASTSEELNKFVLKQSKIWAAALENRPTSMNNQFEPTKPLLIDPAPQAGQHQLNKKLDK